MPDDDDDGEQDLLAATQGQTRRVRPELVNYARRAKRVDVRKLKDNIWKGLGIVVSNDKNDDGEVSMVRIFNLIPIESCLKLPKIGRR
jgi:condensin complex subunit 2